MLKKIFLTILLLFFLAVAAGGAAFAWFVIYHPGEAIRQENIDKILSMESPVFYSDGRSKIGVFFQEAHRQYVPFSQLPENFINGIIASEDQNYWHHHGVDFKGFTRAMIANVQARRIVQGGSTITQQTAKNLFKREGRTVKAKLIELLNAWRLEYYYSKEKILEFYANQFFVSGNGHGLGVAARYYFDKQVSELGLLENAFIVGSVKRPNFYNPFIQKDEKGVLKARKRARERAVYVLSHMHDLGMIDSSSYQLALMEDIPFRQGRMRYPLNTIMDLVKEGMASPEIEETLFEHGIENVTTAGLKVITSIEKDFQELTVASLQKELSRLDVRLSGYDREILQERYGKLPFGVSGEPGVNDFLIGRIVNIDRSSGLSISVSLGQENEPAAVTGVIDETGLMPLLDSLVKYKKQRWSEASKKNLPMIRDRLQPGDLVCVSVRARDALNGGYLLNLEKYPELQGAVLALRNGMIRAMAGGMDNYFYNRAVSAKRPMGSVIKPLIYCAAIQLGWSSVDPLNNERQIFLYQNSPYFPRPDHVSPHRQVSMSWAGVSSENVASVWLLYHLCDHLSLRQFQDLISHVGLAREPDESYLHYQRRIRDQHGVLVNQRTLKRAAFERAVAAVEADLIFASRQQEWETLTLFHYDDDFVYEFDEKDEDKDKKKKRENEIRREILDRSFQRFVALREEISRLSWSWQFNGDDEVIPNLYYQPIGVRLADLDENDLLNGPRFVYSATFSEGGWQAVSRGELEERLAGLDEKKLLRFWSNVLLEGQLSGVTIDLVRDVMDEEFEILTGMRPYDFQLLYEIRDFRVLAGLNYLVSLSRTLGVKSRLDPVLSFPLGSNVISLLEAADMYEGIINGHFREEESQADGLRLISRIEDAHGKVIYQNRRERQIVVDRQTALAVTDILRNVVKFGTGRYAARQIRLRSANPEKEELLAGLDLTVPVLGKTGTANRFTNASFVGLVPSFQNNKNGVFLKNGYVLASYVGYDDNRPMVRTTTHISGASGALPVWTEIANELFVQRDYAEFVDLVDLTFSNLPEVPLWYPDVGQIEVPVGIKNGGLMVDEYHEGDGPNAPVVTFGVINPNGKLRPARNFRPWWRPLEN